MKKIIYNQLLKDITKFFLLSSLSLSLIIWVIQAVNFLDYISEDGHGLLTYFYITILMKEYKMWRVMNPMKVSFQLWDNMEIFQYL